MASCTTSPTSRKSSIASTITEPTERTALLERKKSTVSTLWHQSTVYRVLLTAFLVSLSFGVTQVPLIYVFGVMTCDEYYRHHDSPPSGLSFDRRCNIHEIEGSTARSFWAEKALQLTIFFPAVRLAIQNIGVETGAGLGILIVQLSQIITVIGGPVGYLLALNSLTTEVVEPAERTATLGRLSGCAMFGTALGYFAGGLIGDYLGIIWPFRVTLLLFLLSCVYVQLCLPTIHNKEVESTASRSLSSFFDPIKMFAPQKWVLANGTIQREWGVLLLGIGTFLGVLATSYVPVLLQMYSTDIFGFGTSENGLLISINSLIRGIFLTLVFPPITSRGRKWLDRRSKAVANSKVSAEESGIPDFPTNPEQIPAGNRAMEGATEPVEPSKPSAHSNGRKGVEEEDKASFHFDLMFTKYSLILDGLLTGTASFTTQGWQMYLIAVILPLASGTGPSAKGTILQMCSASQRTGALSAISLVELMARLASTSIFGLVFSGFAEIGQTHLTFTCNAAIALVGFAILMFARLPPQGARRWVEGEEEAVTET